jgi:CheY-like chemotaxis protein
MDMQIPVMDGIEACHLIFNDKRGNGPFKPKVLFVNAHVENLFEVEAARAGSSRFLPKPFNLKGIEMCFQRLELGSRLDNNDSLS